MKFAHLYYLIGFLFLLGCGSPKPYDGPARYQVTGEVTMDGKPIPEGTVQLIPQDQGRRATAIITEGNYTIEEIKGPNAGAYKVEILGYEIIGEAKDEDSGPPTKQIVPEKFNKRSDLKIDIVEGDADANKHDFILTN